MRTLTRPQPHITTETRLSADVLIVGAGPAGLTAAGSLARQGIDVLVVERHSGTSPFPKATGVSTRTMELFRSWGVDQQIRSGAMRVRPVMTVTRTLAAEPFVTVPFGFPTDEEALAVSPVTPSCCPQDHLEPVLLRHLTAHGGRVLFSTELVQLSVDDDSGVAAELRDSGGGRMRVHADYVIGADGPRSTVRSCVGIGLDDLGSLGDFMAVTFRAPLSALRPDGPGAITMVQAPGAEGILVPTSADDRWIYAREFHPDRGQSRADFTPERCRALLRAATGVPDLEPELLTVMPFAMGGHVARSFRSGRALLVGDAAHRTTPVGGTGMNTAIHAAHNLGWKLGWVLRGLAGEALLDTYEEERRPIGTENVLRSMRRDGDQVTGDGLSWDIGVRYPVPDVLGSETTRSDLPAAPGGRAPHAWIGLAGQRFSTLDLFDGQLTMVTGGRAGGWQRAAAELAAEGLPILALSVGTDVSDPDGELTAGFRLGATGAVLVRPDGYVAWRCDGSIDERADLRAAVDVTLARAVRTSHRRAAVA